MKCSVCHMPQPGPHKMSCRPSDRESAERWSQSHRSILLRDSTPWGEKPTAGSMLARLDAFCARYADVCGDGAKAAKVRAPFAGRMR